MVPLTADSEHVRTVYLAQEKVDPQCKCEIAGLKERLLQAGFLGRSIDPLWASRRLFLRGGPRSRTGPGTGWPPCPRQTMPRGS